MDLRSSESSELLLTVLASRMAGFLVASTGALLMGIGAMATWMTVGIPNEPAHTDIRGADLTDGLVVLLCALTVVSAMLATRVVRSCVARELLGLLVAIAGLVAGAIGAAFLVGGKDRDAVIKTLGIPRDIWSQFGAFRDLGPGAYLALLGGLLGFFGGLMIVLWAATADRGRPDIA